MSDPNKRNSNPALQPGKSPEKGELAKASTGVLAVQEEVDAALMGGQMVQGDDRSGADLILRVAVYQGTEEEDQKYPGHSFKKGDLIIPALARKAASQLIVPIVGMKIWQVWPKGAKVPEAVYTSYKDVPQWEREWRPAVTEGGNQLPPVATEVVNYVVCIPGEDQPFRMVFKTTSMKAYNSILSFEASRVRSGKGLGVYEVCSIPDKNREGKPYRRMTIEPRGDVPANVKPLVIMCRKAADTFVKKAAATAVEEMKRGVSDHDDDGSGEGGGGSGVAL